jgi:cell division protein ZapA (FtsZ GTPase activity inhibitor)
MSERRSVTVRIRGREFHIRSRGDADAVQRIAALVDTTMANVERRTGTVDSRDLAMLTALNLAREVVEGRDQQVGTQAEAGRLRALIELAESAVAAEPR